MWTEEEMLLRWELTRDPACACKYCRAHPFNAKEPGDWRAYSPTNPIISGALGSQPAGACGFWFALPVNSWMMPADHQCQAKAKQQVAPAGWKTTKCGATTMFVYEGPLKPAGPVSCKRCNQINEYAEPNQPNGTYVCFECR